MIRDLTKSRDVTQISKNGNFDFCVNGNIIAQNFRKRKFQRRSVNSGRNYILTEILMLLTDNPDNP